MSLGAEPLAQALAQCASEPIRIPGAIQPHGLLLMLYEPSLQVAQVSANCLELLGMAPADLLQKSLVEFLGEHQVEQLRAALSLPDLADGNPLRLYLHRHVFNALLSRHDGLLMLELEPEIESALDNSLVILGAMRRLQAASTLEALYAIATQEIQALTGYDRVMIYRFEPEGHGQVIAQALRGPLPSYNGLYFPASDIPPQARELYRLNPVRLIPHVAYEAVPIVPALRPDTGLPLDLGFCTLRSVSPVHCQYLQNMGVGSSMSLSLLVGNALWGLVSCGHPKALFLNYAVRSVCTVIAQLLSVRIAALLAEASHAQRHELSLRVAELAPAMAEGQTDVFDALAGQPEALMALTGASGLAVLVDERLHLFGQCPTPRQVRALHLWVRVQCLNETGVLAPIEHQGMGIMHTHQLSSIYGPAGDYPDVASGLMAIVLPKPVDNALIWFRPQLTSTMNWGGDPAVHGSLAPEGSAAARLRPRASFSVWQQQVSGQSQAWSDAHAFAANELRRFATESDLARQVRREHEALRLRDELVAVVSHDLRNPMTIVIMQCGIMQHLMASDTRKHSKRINAALDTVQVASARMNHLITDLVETSTLESGHYQLACRPVSVAEALQEACALLVAMASLKRIELNCTCTAALSIHADPERLFQVLSNLLGNAIKFTPDGGRIDLDAWREGDRAMIAVRDNGAGISDKHVARIFDRYWTLREGNPTGSGLGLFICRGIVQAHGGKIWLDTTVKTGSRFVFSMPIAAPDA